MIDPAVSPEQLKALAEARHSAREKRSVWLLGISEGMFDLRDVVSVAREPGNEALLRLRLSFLLGAQPGWGDARVESVLRRFGWLVRHHTSTTLPPKVDVRWLTHPLTPRRLDLWWDVLAPARDLPWDGFPFSGMPVRLS